MKASELYELYIISEYKKKTSLGAYQAKVDKFIKFFSNPNVEDLFKGENIRAFVFDEGQDPGGKYNAIHNFYKFYYEKYLELPQIEIPIFPINKKKEIIDVYKSEGQKAGTVYIPREVGLEVLFEDHFYQHLNSRNAELTIKAAFALALSAGYDSGEIDPTNNKSEGIMTLDDFIIEEDYVKVRNFYTQSHVPWIIIQGENAVHIKNYWEVRKNAQVEREKDKKRFIAKIWSSKELKEFNANREQKKKIYDPNPIISYMLKYISSHLELSTSLNITHLRSNMILHALFKTKGAALKDIIEIFGFPTYVKNSFEIYCEEINTDVNSYFTPYSLEAGTTEEMEEEKKTQKSKESLIDRLVRDSSKVKKLKKIYHNCCQVCGESITLLSGVTYSEVHHIQPFNKDHQGNDNIPNMLVLCPNHHQLFDMGILALDPENHTTILHVDEALPYHQKLSLLKHRLSFTCVRYHYENIFLPLKTKLSKEIIIPLNDK
ncbi:HNH endonuclease [Bacillus sp. B190/17]|uniref:HNH endonuclease n=1 Tax=Bacillus lumedeiriae TaxID=3058829 RepID=A0ABW8I7H8_9BACI